MGLHHPSKTPYPGRGRGVPGTSLTPGGESGSEGREGLDSLRPDSCRLGGPKQEPCFRGPRSESSLTAPRVSGEGARPDRPSRGRTKGRRVLGSRRISLGAEPVGVLIVSDRLDTPNFLRHSPTLDPRAYTLRGKGSWMIHDPSIITLSGLSPPLSGFQCVVQSVLVPRLGLPGRGSVPDKSSLFKEDTNPVGTGHRRRTLLLCLSFSVSVCLSPLGPVRLCLPPS